MVLKKRYALAHNTPKYEIIKWRMTQTLTHGSAYMGTARTIGFDLRMGKRETDQLISIYFASVCVRIHGCMYVWVYALLLFPNNEGQHKRTNNEQMYKHRMELMSKLLHTHTHARTHGKRRTHIHTHLHRLTPIESENIQTESITSVIHTRTHWCIRPYAMNTYILASIHMCMHYYASAMRIHTSKRANTQLYTTFIRASKYYQSKTEI